MFLALAGWILPLRDQTAFLPCHASRLVNREGFAVKAEGHLPLEATTAAAYAVLEYERLPTAGMNAATEAVKVIIPGDVFAIGGRKGVHFALGQFRHVGPCVGDARRAGTT